MISNEFTQLSDTRIDIIDQPECFLILLFWLTICVFGLWLFVHEPADLPILGCAVAMGIYLLSSAMIVRNAFQKSASWGIATALVPAMLYVHVFKNLDSLKNESIVNLVSLAVLGTTALLVLA